MAELVSIATFATFAEAATVAREFAIKNQRQTGVHCDGSKWAVAIAPDLVARLRADVANCDDEGDFEDFDDEHSRALDEEYANAFDDEYADTARDIRSEALETQENWERSDDEGWFYAD